MLRSHFPDLSEAWASGMVTGEREEESDGVLGGGGGVSGGGVDDDDTLFGGGIDVDVVDADACAADNLEA